MNWSGAYKSLQERVTCEIHERLSSHSRDESANKESVGLTVPSRKEDGNDLTQLDCIQWTIDAYRITKTMSVTGVLERVIGFLFASHHQVTPVSARCTKMTRAILNKCHSLSLLHLRYIHCANILSICTRYRRRYRV